MNKIRIRFSLFFVFFVFLFSYSSDASFFQTNPFPTLDPFGLSPYWTWKTLKTQHFEIHFKKELQARAKESARYLEEAHAILSPYFQWEPQEKVQILVLDNRDSANGLASSFVKLGLVLWVTPPDAWSSIGFYDNWLRTLIIHEYVHYLNLDARKGIWKVARPIFGATGLPNSLWHRWMIEGMAVYYETALTKGGRGRNPEFEMILRSAAESKELDHNNFITQDKLSGPNPYYPYGSSPYQFGYYLMQKAADQPPKPDGSSAQNPSVEETLGELSIRSAGQIPFFYNTHLESTTEESWYEVWSNWLEAVRKQTQSDRNTIRSAPINSFERLTHTNRAKGQNISGLALSRDEKYAVFSAFSTDRRPGIHVLNFETKELKRLGDKNNGVGVSFVDENWVLGSEIRYRGQYYRYSDLAAYHIHSGERIWLTDFLRAKDPHFVQAPVGSRRGLVTFTTTDNGTVCLALGELHSTLSGKFELKRIEEIYHPNELDRVSNPQFHPNGREIIFSVHPNGKSQEDLWIYDLKSKQAHLIFQDGFYNRYPTFSSDGNLYYVSNKTGVENIYLFRKNQPRLVTNVITGLGFPFIPRDATSHAFYAVLQSHHGSEIVRMEPLEKEISAETVTIHGPPIPKPPTSLQANAVQNENEWEISDYSAWNYLVPRIWTPIIGIRSGLSTQLDLGVQAWGFDSIDEHRYTLGALWNFGQSVPNATFLYSNRSLGPTIDISGDWQTRTSGSASLGSYENLATLSSVISYPVPWTWSSFSPFIGGSVERSYGVHRSQALSPIHSFAAGFTIADTETSPLAINQEGGRITTLSSRVSLLPNQTVWKLFFQDVEYIRLIDHVILIPSVNALWTSMFSNFSLNANGSVRGRDTGILLNAGKANGFSGTGVRGYPNLILLSRATATMAVDLQFPLLRIFRGWGTRPLFLENIYGITFFEIAAGDFTPFIGSFTSAGAGVRMSGQIFHIPLIISAEIHHGFRKNLGGASDFFVTALFRGFSF